MRHGRRHSARESLDKRQARNDPTVLTSRDGVSWHRVSLGRLARPALPAPSRRYRRLPKSQRKYQRLSLCQLIRSLECKLVLRSTVSVTYTDGTEVSRTAPFMQTAPFSSNV